MIWIFLAILLATVVYGAKGVTTRRKEAGRLQAAADRDLVLLRKVTDEDVTQFGEELQDLHIETMTSTLDFETRQDYQKSLDSYEHAKSLLREAHRPEDIPGVTKALEDGRYAKACVLARQDGRGLPERRPPCFFNPAHGPAHTDVEWAPRGGTPREIPVCLEDANRLVQGAEPDARLVRSGADLVPWYQAGPRYANYAQGYYAEWATKDLFPTFILGTNVGGWNNGGWMGDAGYDSGGGHHTGGHHGGGHHHGGFDGGHHGGGQHGGGHHGGGHHGGFDAGGGGFDGGGGGSN